jgi:arylsulfatase
VIDVMATCLDIAGARYPGERGGRPVPGLEGKSMLPVFEGRKPPGRTALFWEHEGNRAVMKGRWKLVSRHPLPWYHGRAKVVDPGDGRWELYDMEEDRTEMRNLAGEFPARVDELRAEYERWAEGCRIPEWNPNRRP